MISILIPVFNTNCTQLVKQLQTQCELTGLVYEIIIADDASTNQEIKSTNSALASIKNVQYIELTNNIGRSAIRNYLASIAKQTYLLFIDDDMAMVDEEYIKRYANVMESDEVIYGGLVYPTYYKETALLRETFGNEREIKSLADRLKSPTQNIATCNLVVKKSVFDAIKFNESIKQYGWEDNLFALQLAQKGVKIAHINNPLLHTGIESNEVYLAKTIIACKTLASLVLSEQYKLELQSIKLYRAYQNLAKLNLIGLFCFCFKIIKTGIENHLCAKQPNLIYFDLWKLYQLAMALNSSHTSVNHQ